jgi:hypothetical protein
MTTDQWLDAPDAPGLWACCREGGETVWLTAFSASESISMLAPPPFVINIINGAKTTPSSGYRWKFHRVTIDMPDPPKPPGPWDYMPNVGDWVWVRWMESGRVWGHSPIKVASVTEDCVVSPAYGFSMMVYQFAKAEVSPPPE